MMSEKAWFPCPTDIDRMCGETRSDWYRPKRLQWIPSCVRSGFAPSLFGSLLLDIESLVVVIRHGLKQAGLQVKVCAWLQWGRFILGRRTRPNSCWFLGCNWWDLIWTFVFFTFSRLGPIGQPSAAAESWIVNPRACPPNPLQGPYSTRGPRPSRHGSASPLVRNSPCLQGSMSHGPGEAGKKIWHAAGPCFTLTSQR